MSSYFLSRHRKAKLNDTAPSLPASTIFRQPNKAEMERSIDILNVDFIEAKLVRNKRAFSTD